MQQMFKALGTPENLKEEKAFPNTGAHEIASDLVSNNHDGVREATLAFLNRILN